MMAANMATTQDGSLAMDMQTMEALTKAATANSSGLGNSLNILNALNENPEVDQAAVAGIAADGSGNEAGMDVAMAAQLMQLNRFHMQQRVFETQKNIASGDMPTRFKEGFRPMQLCKQFVKSATCVRGEKCSYAHTFEELHPMSPELPGAESAKVLEALEDETETPLADLPEPPMRMR